MNYAKFASCGGNLSAGGAATVKVLLKVEYGYGWFGMIQTVLKFQLTRLLFTSMFLIILLFYAT